MPNNSQGNDSCDIDGPRFNAKAYIDKLLNEKDLSDLLAKETEIVEQIRSLDSEMQTLVYDNYNRFICATDTIKMMKTDFTTVETEMNSLASKISDVKTTANDLKSLLIENREELKNLAATQDSLVKLQYLFDLPKTLRECLEQKNLAKAVSHYRRGKIILNTHSESPGLQGIRAECETVMEEIYQICMEKFKQATSAALDIPMLANQMIVLYSLVDDFFEMLQEFASRQSELIRYAFTEPILSWTSSIKQSQLQIMFRAARLCGAQSLARLKKMSLDNKSYTANVDFHVEFCVQVCREGLIVAYLDFLTDTALTMTRFPQMTTSCPELSIIFGKMFYEWAVTGTRVFLRLNLVHPSLMQTGSRKLINARIAKFTKPLSLSGPISERLKEVATKLLTTAARQKGDQIGALLQKSIDTRDWLKSAEPRSVRSVIKRVLDVELSAFSINMTYLFGEDQQEPGKGKQEPSATFSFPTTGQMPSQLRHLFSGHKLDFGESVTPSKDSIVAAAVKTALKTLIECVRMKSFSKYGLQQMQIDCHCLKIHLENFVLDPAAAHILLEEAMVSAEKRCVDISQLLDERVRYH
ncbi:Vacuolar protein sorting-associated protein 51 [Cichlidogyrus casuarinus]|uniref:Vacuolar protein sorting-associated protein 51 homolog n=1 Tax=Cichlidogyrus casuarinus TaxID=1844966 RepID=A0ABD2Q4I6_9PLAT